MKATGKPWKLRAPLRIAAEISLIVGGLAAIDYLLLAGNAFLTINPNPYWLPVLLFSLTYGTEAGLMVATVTSILWLVGNQETKFPGDFFEQAFHKSLPAMLWYASAIAVGEVTYVRRRNAERVGRRLASTRERLAVIAHYLTRLHATNRSLQLQIVTQETGVAEALKLSSELAFADIDHKLKVLHQMIAVATRTQGFACIISDHGDLRYPFERLGDLRRTGIPPDFLGRLARHSGIITAANQDQRRDLPFGAVIAIPIYPQGSATILGAIIIYDMAFEDLSDTYLSELALMPQWVGNFFLNLARTHRYEFS